MSRKLTVVFDYLTIRETYSRIGQVKYQGNLQSYWTSEVSRKLTVVLDYLTIRETYSRIGQVKYQGKLQSYWTSEVSRKLTVVLDYYEPIKPFVFNQEQSSSPHFVVNVENVQ